MLDTILYCNIELCFNHYRVTKKLGNPKEIHMLGNITTVKVSELIKNSVFTFRLIFTSLFGAEANKKALEKAMKHK